MKKLKFLVAGAVVAVALVAVGALAAWIVMQTISINNNVTGIATQQTSNLAVTPTSAIWSVTAAGPGEGAFGRLKVANSGATSSRFSLAAAHTNATVAAGTKLRVVDISAEATCPSCDCHQDLNPDGTQKALFDPTKDVEVYYGTAAAFVLGDPTAGQQTGDIAVSPGSSKFLCFSVMFPTPGNSALSGLTSVTTLTLTGDPGP
jgi:hypothetical protein